MTSRHSRRIVTAVAALLAGVRAASAAPEAASPLKLVDLKLFPDTAKGHFGTPLGGFEFPGDQKRHLAILYFDKAAAGQKVAVKVVGAKTTLGLEKLVKAFEPVAIDPEGRIPFELSYPSPWPVGLYRLEAWQGDRLVGNAGYRVMPAAPKKTAVELLSVKIYREKAGGGVEEVPSPRAADRHLYFAGATRGTRTDGAKVTWVCTAVDTPAGKERKVTGIDVDAWPLKDTTLTFDVELPGDWPPGKYRVDVAIDGAPIGSHAYEIGP